jgi:tetratricopeptide (TPR) repeat protein
LDSTLVEVQYALAIVTTWTDWDWEGAEAAYQRAMELNPNFPDVRAYYSHFLCMTNRPDEALTHMERAVELDPFNPLLQGLHGMVLWAVGQYDESLAQFQRLLRTVPNHPLALAGLLYVYTAKGMDEEALAAAQSYFAAMEFSQGEEALAQGYADGGYRGAMKRAADAWAARANVTYVLPTEIATLYAFAGEDESALHLLERGFEERDPNMPYVNAIPVYDSLRDDPRFIDLLRRMNLPQ